MNEEEIKAKIIKIKFFETKVYKVCLNILMIITCFFLILGFFWLQKHIDTLEKHPCQVCRDKGYICIAPTGMIVPSNYAWVSEAQQEREEAQIFMKQSLGGNVDVQ